VRIGTPSDITGLKDVVATPQFANGVGLLKYGIRMNKFRGQGMTNQTCKAAKRCCPPDLH